VDELFTVTKQYQGMISSDQDVFNIVFKGKYKELEKRYNPTLVDLKFYKVNKMTKEYNNTTKEAMIFHFNAGSKPWKFTNVDYAKEWLWFSKMGIFYEEIKENLIKQTMK
jgi:lipopolysaccharide biosynthesis glycosyltransferase